MAGANLVTLLTDFGTSSPYVAAMKGVILRACGTAQIVDLCHHVPPHDVLAGAFILGQSAPCFPPETLHVVVVDPGVGTGRAILAGRFGGQTFLFPDNGVITLIAEAMPLEEMVWVQPAALPPPEDISPTFHGRDIFAPLAGRLLGGQALGELGPAPPTYKLLEIPRPRQTGDRIVGQVIFVDGFGNLVSNIPAYLIDEWGRGPEEEVSNPVTSGEVSDPVTSGEVSNPVTSGLEPRLEPRMEVRCGATPVGRLEVTYGSVPANRPVAVVNSMGLVEVAVNQGRACDAFRAAVGTEVQVAVAGAAP